MHTNSSAFAGKILIWALWAALAWLALRFLLPWTAPMLLAFAFALALEPAVKALCRRGMVRPAAAGLCLLGFLAVFGAGLWFLLSRLAGELGRLGEHLPETAAALSAKAEELRSALASFLGSLPPELVTVLDSAAAGLRDYLSELPGRLSARAVETFTAFVAELPTWLLFAVTWLMGSYFISAAYPQLSAGLKRQLPRGSFHRLRSVKRSLQQSFGRYLKAQLIMSAITFGEALLIFLLLGLDYAFVPAAAVALIDALPVFGAGTVLLPWAAWELIGGDPDRGLGLAIGYAAITLLRSCIQAKLLGDQLGLHPIATLLAIYAGWKAMGIWGMLLFPIAAISLKRLNDSGAIQLWKGKDTNDGNNFQYNSRDGHEYSGGHEHKAL